MTRCHTAERVLGLLAVVATVACCGRELDAPCGGGLCGGLQLKLDPRFAGANATCSDTFTLYGEGDVGAATPRNCPHSYTPYGDAEIATGVRVRWSNRTTGAEGFAEQFLDCLPEWPPDYGPAPLYVVHTWDAAVPLRSGDNDVVIRAERSGYQPVELRANVVRGAPCPVQVDVLFVVDDSGTMASKQTRLGQGFTWFVSEIARVQLARGARDLAQLDIDVAVTTSSVFEGWQPPLAPTCQAAPGGALQCEIASPAYEWTPAYTYACTPEGAACGDLVRNYRFNTSCSGGVARDGAPYPAGDLVAAGGNPAVLHFDHALAWDSWGTAAVDPALAALVSQFQANVSVGTCGSGMEQHLEAGRLALKKAIARSQGGSSAAWPHAGSKLVVVWVGDEDDCSSPDDPMKAILFAPGRLAPGSDACTIDATAPLGSGRAFPVSEYADYFTSLGHPFSAAFIYSAVNCRGDGMGTTVCDPGACQCVGNADASCGGFAAGSRFHELSIALRSRGVQTIEGSVCADFAPTFTTIANTLSPLP